MTGCFRACESEPSVCSDVCVIYKCVSVYELERKKMCVKCEIGVCLRKNETGDLKPSASKKLSTPVLYYRQLNKAAS